ncbi:MAG TPA: DNA mismatch repair protein MutS [Deltaproteobacteria bacterium]|nr:DNA mismatch repair protein MutS [Deltaproteobacteria bacterium]
MKSSRDSLHYQPFRKLADAGVETSRPRPDDISPEPRDEGEGVELFLRAVEGAIPIDRGREYRGKTECSSRDVRRDVFLRDDDDEVLASLRQLVENGTGFSVSDTPEYLEGVLYQDSNDIAERLHRGEFSIQDHIDLHGMRLDEARDALNDFFRVSLERGLRGILIIHGRGKSSPVRPVLKTLVKEWLKKGPFRSRVIAFSSARMCDGGAGATYVLFRSRPLTKRGRKRVKGKEKR